MDRPKFGIGKEAIIEKLEEMAEKLDPDVIAQNLYFMGFNTIAI